LILRISEAQSFVREIIKKYGLKRNPLSSLIGVMEELGEFSSKLLVREGFKKGRVKEHDIGYTLAEVFFELLKLAEDCNVDLEKEFVEAMKTWRGKEPRWI